MREAGVSGVAIALLVIYSLLAPSALAVTVNHGTIFQTTGSGCDYHMAGDFGFINITVYSTNLSINGANITTYPSSGGLNISIATLNATFVNFTNNATVANVTIEDDFANFSVTDTWNYHLRHIANDTVFQQATASSSKIVFTSIPSGTFYIPSDTIAPTINGTGLSSTSVVVGDVVTISCTVTDTGSGVANVSVQTKDAKDRVNVFTMIAGAGNTYTFEFTSTGKIGTYYVEYFRSYDNASNLRENSSSLTFSTYDPSGTGAGAAGGADSFVPPRDFPTATPTPPTTDVVKEVIIRPFKPLYNYLQWVLIYSPFMADVNDTKQFHFTKVANKPLVECLVSHGECYVAPSDNYSIVLSHTESDDTIWVEKRQVNITIYDEDGYPGWATMDILVINIAAYFDVPPSTWSVDDGAIWHYFFKFEKDVDHETWITGARVWWVSFVVVAMALLFYRTEKKVRVKSKNWL